MIPRLKAHRTVCEQQRYRTASIDPRWEWASLRIDEKVAKRHEMVLHLSMGSIYSGFREQFRILRSLPGILLHLHSSVSVSISEIQGKEPLTLSVPGLDRIALSVPGLDRIE